MTLQPGKKSERKEQPTPEKSKWIYVEDAKGCLIGKTFATETDMRQALINVKFRVIATISRSDHHVVMRLFG